MPAIRLQKVLAACGIGSRRACEELIEQGRVTVDREVVTELGTRVDPEQQDVRCDGVRLRPPHPRYYLLNKPRGVICSAKGMQGRPKAIDYVPPEAVADRLFTVGRLDVDSEGAIILTNDGELCHRVTHPRFGVEKSYRVEVEGFADDETILKMRKGVWLAEGRTSSLKIRMIARRPDRTVLDMTLNEGMKREIRRVCARFGHEVRRLVRVAIGPIRLESLPVGAIRELSPEEVAALTDSADAVIKLGSRPHQSRRPARGRHADADAHGHDDGYDEAPKARSAAKPASSRGGKTSGGRGKSPAAKADDRGGRSGARGAKAASGRGGKASTPFKASTSGKPSSYGKTRASGKSTSSGKPGSFGKSGASRKSSASGKSSGTRGGGGRSGPGGRGSGGSGGRGGSSGGGSRGKGPRAR